MRRAASSAAAGGTNPAALTLVSLASLSQSNQLPAVLLYIYPQLGIYAWYDRGYGHHQQDKDGV